VAYTVSKLVDYSVAALEKAAAACVRACADEAGAVRNDAELKAFRDRWMARKSGILTQINDLWLKGAPKDAKREAGIRVNELKTRITELVDGAKEDLARRQFAGTVNQDNQAIERLFRSDRTHAAYQTESVSEPVWDRPDDEELDRQLRHRRQESERIDVTLPGVRRPIGAEHPVIKTTNEMVRVFQKLGYSVAEGPVVETDYYNFEALNFPPNHPARDTQDTLFIAGQQGKAQRERLLLRTHTSPVQIRTMEKMRPPIRIVIPGTVHRNDPPDASHSPMFHQIEGLAVDTNITFGDLKGTLDHAMKEFFGSSVKTSFRPSFFPFTEPSAEMFVSCFICGGSGKRGADPCRPCKQTGWIEILGCGMVDPNVFEFVKDNGYDPRKVSGFAFGMGADRIALLKYGVDDLQLFFNGDVRFLEQWA
jgi:phenylalanyl-tRNA synthetase alpha chain